MAPTDGIGASFKKHRSDNEDALTSLTESEIRDLPRAQLINFAIGIKCSSSEGESSTGGHPTYHITERKRR